MNIRIKKILSKKGVDKKRPTWLDGIVDYQPSEKKIQSKIITCKYDKQIEELGIFLLQDLDKIEQFVTKEWGDMLPGKMYFNLVDSIGPSPFNSCLNDAYFKVGHYFKSNFIKEYFSSTIVHEIGHYVESNYLKRASFQITNEEISSYKFIAEGYQEWKRTEYIDKHNEYGIYADNCAFHMLSSSFFILNDLIEQWIKIMFDYLNFPIYETATSFTYFLEKKLGYDKINNIFKSIHDYSNAKNWNDYLNGYFNRELIDLMNEWKKEIIENIGSQESTEESIITYLEVIEKRGNEIILRYKSNFPLWAGHNIFIYDNEMKLLSIKKIEKYRFLKEGNLKITVSRLTQIKLFIYFFSFKQIINFDLENDEIFLKDNICVC